MRPSRSREGFGTASRPSRTSHALRATHTRRARSVTSPRSPQRPQFPRAHPPHPRQIRSRRRNVHSRDERVEPRRPRGRRREDAPVFQGQSRTGPRARPRRHLRAPRANRGRPGPRVQGLRPQEGGRPRLWLGRGVLRQVPPRRHPVRRRPRLAPELLPLHPAPPRRRHGRRRGAIHRRAHPTAHLREGLEVLRGGVHRRRRIGEKDHVPSRRPRVLRR